MNFTKYISKKAIQFSVLTFVLSILPFYLVLTDDSSDSDWVLLLMWTPGIAAIILRLYHREGLFSGFSWNPLKNLKWVFIAVFAPFLIEVTTILCSTSIGVAEFKTGFLSMSDGLITIKNIAMIFGAAPQPIYQLIPNFLLSFFVGVLLYSIIFAFGEEYGWRGYLQKHFGNKNTFMPFLIIGLIWGYWHLPAILLQGHNYPDYPILGGLVLMPITTIALSACFGIALEKSNVIWVPAIFHGSLNMSSQISSSALIEETMNRPITDLIWTSLWILLAVSFWIKFKKKLSSHTA